MSIRHPTGEILHILADAGIEPAKLHDVQRRIAAAYSEANEGRQEAKEAPAPEQAGGAR